MFCREEVGLATWIHFCTWAAVLHESTMIVIHTVKLPRDRCWVFENDRLSKDKGSQHKDLLVHSSSKDCQVWRDIYGSECYQRTADNNILQFRVASEGIRVIDEVVLSELAPFSSSMRIFLAQKGRNLARVFSGLALATHSTNWWIALTAFDLTVVLA